MNRRQKAQTTLEYAILVVIIIAAFLAMQQYVKRGFQGRWKTTMDDFGDQYDPYFVNAQTNYTLISNSDTSIQTLPAVDPNTGAQGFYTNRVDNTHSIEKKQGSSFVGVTTNNAI